MSRLVHHPITNAVCLRLSRTRSAPFPWETRQTKVYASGREAVVALLRTLRLAPGTEVLLPAYVPEGIIAPFRRAGLTVLSYPLTRYLAPSWSHLDALMKSRSPSIAVIIHYFGMPQDMDEFCRRCRARGTLVLEDLAHVLQLPDSPLGRFGDIVLYSLPKMLGVPDGAPLVVRTPAVNVDQLHFEYDRRHTAYLARQLARLAVSTVSRRLVNLSGARLLEKIMPWRLRRLVDGYDTLMGYFETPNAMSGISRFLLERSDWERAVSHRRRLARLYEENLDRELYERFPGTQNLPHGMVGFPVLVGDRTSLYEHLRRHGLRGAFYEHRWDFFPENNREVHAEAIETMKHHFLFPTSQSVSAAEAAHFLEVANRWEPGRDVAGPRTGSPAVASSRAQER